MLIGGVRGSGKSVKLAVYCAAAVNDPDTDVWLMDGKNKLELRDWADSAVDLVGDKAEAVKMLRRLHAQMTANVARLDELGLKVIKPGCGIRKQMLVCDELAVFLLADADDKKGKKDAEVIGELLRQLAALGRAAGIAMILATQRPDADTVPTRLREMFNYRDGMRAMNPVSAEMVLPIWTREGFDSSRITTGQRGVSFLLTEEEWPRRIRGFHLGDDNAIRRLAERAAARRRHDQPTIDKQSDVERDDESD